MAGHTSFRRATAAEMREAINLVSDGDGVYRPAYASTASAHQPRAYSRRSLNWRSAAAAVAGVLVAIPFLQSALQMTPGVLASELHKNSAGRCATTDANVVDVVKRDFAAMAVLATGSKDQWYVAFASPAEIENCAPAILRNGNQASTKMAQMQPHGMR